MLEYFDNDPLSFETLKKLIFFESDDLKSASRHQKDYFHLSSYYTTWLVMYSL